MLFLGWLPKERTFCSTVMHVSVSSSPSPLTSLANFNQIGQKTSEKNLQLSPITHPERYHLAWEKLWPDSTESSLAPTEASSLLKPAGMGTWEAAEYWPGNILGETVFCVFVTSLQCFMVYIAIMLGHKTRKLVTWMCLRCLVSITQSTQLPSESNSAVCA